MSIALKLSANGSTEQRVLDYLTANVSEVLAEKINAGTKTLDGALKYARDEARKLSTGEVVCVEDSTVFGWIVHYFEEDHIEEKPKATVKLPSAMAKKIKTNADLARHPVAKKEAAPPKPAKRGKTVQQMTMFETLLGAVA